ncbi:MAG: hypothetical protein AAFY46_07140, partial [Planctomycetota bacterium]
MDATGAITKLSVLMPAHNEARTIREIVQLGRAAVSDDDVRGALERVGLLERIMLLPDGLNTALN